MARPAPRPQTTFAPPLAARPAAAGAKRKTLGSFELNIDSMTPEDMVIIKPAVKECWVHPRTWRWLQHDNAALGAFVHEKAEAVRQMKVVMWDVAAYNPSAATADPNRQVAPVPMGITLLCRDLAILVGDLSKLDPNDSAAVTVLAGRYGKLRDTMAKLRASFTEAEGSFDIAQALLVQKMGLDD